MCAQVQNVKLNWRCWCSLGFPLLIRHLVGGNGASVAGSNAADIGGWEEARNTHKTHSSTVQIYLSQMHVFQKLQTWGKSEWTQWGHLYEQANITLVRQMKRRLVCSVYDFTVICDPCAAEIKLKKLIAADHTFPHYCVPHPSAG